MAKPTYTRRPSTAAECGEPVGRPGYRPAEITEIPIPEGPNVQSRLESLYKTVAELNEAIEHLTNRLGPVLVDGPGCSAESTCTEGPGPSKGLSTLGLALSNLQYQLRGVIGKIGKLNEEVDL